MRRRFPSRQRLATPLPRPVDGRRLLATNMRKYRLAREMTQEQLAELTGLNRAYLSLVENTHRTMSLDNMCKIAAALGVHPRRLLDPEDG